MYKKRLLTRIPAVILAGAMAVVQMPVYADDLSADSVIESVVEPDEIKQPMEEPAAENTSEQTPEPVEDDIMQPATENQLSALLVLPDGTIADIYLLNSEGFDTADELKAEAITDDGLKDLIKLQKKNDSLDTVMSFKLGLVNNVACIGPMTVKVFLDDVSSLNETELYQQTETGELEHVLFHLQNENEKQYVEFTCSSLGNFMFVKENKQINSFSWSGDITTQNNQDIKLDVNITGEKEFSESDILDVKRINEAELTEKIPFIKYASHEEPDIILPLSIKINDESGIEASMDEAYIIKIVMQNAAILNNAELYHEKLNGSWEPVSFVLNKNEGYVQFTSTDGLGNFVFTTNANVSNDISDDLKIDDASQNIIPDADGPDENKSSQDITVNEPNIEETEAIEQDATEEMPSNESDEAAGEDSENDSTKPLDKASTISEDANKNKNEVASEETEIVNDESTDQETEETTDIQPTENQEEGQVPEVIEPESIFTYADSEVIIKAYAQKESEIPDTAVLHADKLHEGSDAYDTAIREVENSMNLTDDEELLFIPYDVYFMDDNERIEPAEGEVRVEMNFKQDLFKTNADSKNDTFAAHIKSDGVVEHIENQSKLKNVVEFLVNSFSVMGPAKIEARAADTKNVAPIIIDSLNASFVNGAELIDGKYVWTPSEAAAKHNFIYRVEYTVSGTFSTDKGAFKIEVPLHILKDRDGNWADTFDCPYHMESELTSDDNPDFVYSIDEKNNKAYIYNYKPYPTGEAGYIEVSYTTSKNTTSYVDMSSSEKFTAKAYATNVNSTVTAQAEATPVYINTTASISYVQKKLPDYYTAWQNKWGTKPADADNYLYLVWTIRSYINKNTSPYSFILEDNFTDIGGNVVGYKFAGQTKFSTVNHIDNLTGYGDRYDYVLTRHNKAEANALLTKEHDYQYTVNNKIKAIVSPTDHIDSDTYANSSQSWSYEVPHYIFPTGHFWAEKWGLYAGNEIVESSEDITDYTLEEFVKNEENEIKDIKYYTYAEGYPYPWTLGDGADGTVNDALNGLFGKKKVNYEFTDDTFYLEDQKLSDDDYNLAYVKWIPIINDAVFNQTTYQFNETPLSAYKSEDNITIYVRVGTEWKEACIYNMNSKTYENVNSSYIQSASKQIINFTKNVKGVRFICSNAYFHTRFNVYPGLILNRTDNVLSILGNIVKARVKNEAYCKVIQNDHLLFERTVTGTDYIQKVIRESEIYKDVTKTQNNKRKKEYYVTWRINAKEKYTDNAGLHYIIQNSGIFYDLLPAGGILDVASISVSDGNNTLNSNQYSINTIDNYKNSGRTMLIIDIDVPGKKGYSVSYQTVHPYTAIGDYGKNLLNSVAYESGNKRIGEGFPDDGGNITDKDLFVNLDHDTDDEKFLYAEARYYINIPVAAGTGLKKQIKSDKDTRYSYETIVHMNEKYNYQIRLTNDSFTQAKDIMFFDSLENFYQKPEETSPTIKSDWKGSLEGINVANLYYKNVNPKIYLSNVNEMNIQNHHDLSEKINGKNVWIDYDTFVQQYGLDKATAIAIDATSKNDGSSFILDKNESMSFDIYMQAPKSDSSNVSDPTAYNNIYVSRTAIRSDGEEVTEIPQFYHQDYTKAHYRISADFKLNKVDETDNTTPVKDAEYRITGTSDYGTEYNESSISDKSGHIIFSTIEKGTYELREIDCTDDWQLNTETYIVVIDGNGKVKINGLTADNNGYFKVTDKPRIHADLPLIKINHATSGAMKDVNLRLSGTSDYGNDYLLYATTNELGYTKFENIELGTYEISESETPVGYIPRQKPWILKIDNNGIASLYDEDTAVKTDKRGYYMIENEPYHSIRFVKSSSYGTNIYLEGAEFSLKGVSDYGTDVNMTAVSGPADDGGLVVFSGLEPGTYTLQETKAPEGHDLNDKLYTVKVNKDGSFTIDGLEKIQFGAQQ